MNSNPPCLLRLQSRIMRMGERNNFFCCFRPENNQERSCFSSFFVDNNQTNEIVHLQLHLNNLNISKQNLNRKNVFNQDGKRPVFNITLEMLMAVSNAFFGSFTKERIISRSILRLFLLRDKYFIGYFHINLSYSLSSSEIGSEL